jgi:hypothetical protein
MNRDFTRYQELPLTPALSRQKRENCPPTNVQAKAVGLPSVLSADVTEVRDKTNPHGDISERHLLFPPPMGEGQGEGKPVVHQLRGSQQIESFHS